ncbi:MAG: putative porin [Bdellovibrionales bacterium]
MHSHHLRRRLYPTVALALLAIQIPTFAQAPNWYDRIQLNGDLRVRQDYISKESSGDTSARHRTRMRLRLGTQALITEDLTALVRLATGDNANPIGGDSTWTDNANKKNIYVDRAYLDWKFAEDMNALLGKQANPLPPLKDSQLIYDDDYAPEGLSWTLRGPLFATIGAYVIKEREPGNTGASDPDSYLLAAVTGWRGNLTDDWKFTVGAGYHAFTAIKNHGPLPPGNTTTVSAGSFLGNSNSGSVFLNDYNVVELFGELVWEISKDHGLSFYVDAIQNVDIGQDNTGLVAGTTFVIRDEEKPLWTLGYAYQTVAKDATLSAVNSSDFAMGLDGAFGHIGTVARRVAPNTTVKLSWFHTQIDNNGSPWDSDRGQLDVMASF